MQVFAYNVESNSHFQAKRLENGKRSYILLAKNE